MNEKEAIERLNKILEEWQQILNIEDKVDREIEMSMYFEDMPFIEIQAVLQVLKDKDNRIDELEKALIEVDFKYRNKIDKLKNKLKEDKEKMQLYYDDNEMNYYKQIDYILEILEG